jgi:osmotically-inducible protein OsmY
MSDENRSSWRPQDEGSADPRMAGRDREYGDEERFAWRERERMGSQWDDRSGRWDDREDRSRSTEYYGQGQSGYGAGRHEQDRSYPSRQQASMNRNERYPDRGTDERFVGGRGGPTWRPDDRYMGRHDGGGGYLAQGGQEMGYDEHEMRYGRDQSDRSGGQGVRNQGGMYGQGGYNDGMYGNGGMQNRYGSQGYQGWSGSSRGTQDERGMGSHRGKGPSGYTRSDERIREIVCEVLTDDDRIDATNIEVNVKNGEVTLSGSVDDRSQKRMAEDRIENLSCVKDVVNQLRIRSSERERSSAASSTSRETGRDMNRDNGHSETPSSSDKRHRA